MLSERERRALEEIEREVTAQDPGLAESLSQRDTETAAPHDRWPYTAAVYTAWALMAACLLLGLPGGLIAASALAMLAIVVRRWRFPAPRAEPQDGDPP